MDLNEVTRRDTTGMTLLGTLTYPSIVFLEEEKKIGIIYEENHKFSADDKM